MKIKLAFLVVLLINFSTIAYRQPLRKIINEVFQRGEILGYRVYYDAPIIGAVTAGEAKLEVSMENSKIANRNIYRISFDGKTKDSYNWFYRVSDHYETFVDEEALIPWIFIRRIEEGHFSTSQNVTLNQIKKTAQTNNKSPIKIKSDVQDVISVLYYARTLNYDAMKIGNIIPIDYFLDDTVWVTKLHFLGKETVKTQAGNIKCIKLKPLVLKGRVFKELKFRG